MTVAVLILVALVSNGCSESCRDELNASVFIDLTNAAGKSCDVTLASATASLVYRCPAHRSSCADDALEQSCVAVGNAPKLAHCERYRCSFTLETLNESEAQALENALGGTQFTFSADCEGNDVSRPDSQGQIGTTKCEG